MNRARVLHAHLLKSGHQHDAYRCNLLLRSYAQSGLIGDAHNLLRFMPNPNVISYNTVLSGYLESSSPLEALEFFHSSSPVIDSHSWNILISGLIRCRRIEVAMAGFMEMRRGLNRPDCYTYSTVLPCCDFRLGRQIHTEIVKTCSGSDAFVGTNLLKMYAGFGWTGDARKVLDEMPERDLVSWNVMISSSFGEESVALFRQMCREGIKADGFTYASLLNEFIRGFSIHEAMQVHSLIIRHGFVSDQWCTSALTNLYCKCGLIDSALPLFEELAEPDIVSWTSVVVGLAQSGHVADALRMLTKMRYVGLMPNSFTLGGLLGACALTCTLNLGKQLHGLVIKLGLENSTVVASSIMNVYSNCGEMDNALKAFNNMSKKDIVSWNGLLCGFAENGEAAEVIELYNEMISKNESTVTPNDVTFLAVLNACSHGGFIREAYTYFNDMVQRHSITSKKEHYTCIVGLLARVSLLEEAKSLIHSLPMEPDGVMWGSLLAGCRLHGNTEMATDVMKRVSVEEPSSSSPYVLLGNLCTEVGDWHESFDIREAMEERGVLKLRGCSSVEVGSCVHSFVAGDRLHPDVDYLLLRKLCHQVEHLNDDMYMLFD